MAYRGHQHLGLEVIVLVDLHDLLDQLHAVLADVVQSTDERRDVGCTGLAGEQSLGSGEAESDVGLDPFAGQRPDGAQTRRSQRNLDHHVLGEGGQAPAPGSAPPLQVHRRPGSCALGFAAESPQRAYERGDAAQSPTPLERGNAQTLRFRLLLLHTQDARRSNGATGQEVAQIEQPKSAYNARIRAVSEHGLQLLWVAAVFGLE